MPGGIFVRRREQFAEEDRVLLQTVARVLLTGGEPLLAQLNRRARAPDGMPWLNPTRSLLAAQAARAVDVTPGFVEGGRAYRIVTTAAAPTPAPWSNILANPHFGTLVTESGGGYTWCENSHEFRITPWGNDPVSDQPGESIYLRDEESGALWSPTPLPCAGEGAYEIHHRFGRSTFAHTSQGVQSEATVFVARDAPVKLTLLRIKNVSPQRRVLSVTGYCEWTLGEHRSRSLLTVTTEVDEQSGALLARNPLHPDFGARLAFFVSGGASRVTVTGDRAEFLGRNGHPARPAAMRRKRLSGRVGAGLDACGAIMAPLTLEAGESAEVVFVLGVGRSLQDVRTLVERFGGVSAAHAALEEVSAWWEEALGGVQVETPEPALDALVNGWLPYQVISSRLWGRTGLYQSGGAFGFRDQLQDAMGLMLSQPAMLREQIIRCAGRQFPDGDVQHWWHPPVGRGVRTHCSDDFLWLPAAVSRYVEAFGDTGVLEVRAHYLEGRQVKPHEEAYLDLPHRSEASATVYEHCVAAIERGLRFGERGLPLIGSGDWNDGMNLVGQRGRGESVWLGFFTFDVLERFAPVARGRGDEAFAARCIEQAASLRRQVEAHAWDGAWYGRAWFDDGTPLGVAARAECQIDAVPQSWAVLSGLATAERAQIAMEALDTRLVDRGLGIIKLLAPPFDVEAPNPGYIRGYAPGVRENGGQYTHAAVWAAMAFARLGDWRRAWELTGMLSPASHTRTAAAREQYRVEPYVLAADIYAVAPHGGMGGWTWQTGSAAWMLRLVVESLLGLTLRVDELTLNPCVPPGWPGFTLRYRHRRTRYVLRARPCGPGEAVGVASVDGVAAPGGPLTLVDDGGEHVVVMCYAALVG
jgi:cellobiose phosphorylase